jgi:hypothetical protein
VRSRRGLVFALGATAFVAALEFWGGARSHSLALKRECRIDPGSVGDGNDDAANDDRDRAQHVAQNVKECRAQIEIVTALAMQHDADAYVERQAGRSDDRHGGCVRFERRAEPPNRFVRDDDRGNQQ